MKSRSLAALAVAPDWVKVERMVGLPDYGVAFCVSPWPDGGWLAGVQITDREWVERQANKGQIDLAMLSIPGSLKHGYNPRPAWDIYNGFSAGLNALGKNAAEAVENLWTKIHFADAKSKPVNAGKVLGWYASSPNMWFGTEGYTITRGSPNVYRLSRVAAQIPRHVDVSGWATLHIGDYASLNEAMVIAQEHFAPGEKNGERADMGKSETPSIWPVPDGTTPTVVDNGQIVSPVSLGKNGSSHLDYRTPGWLYERVNDSFGTPTKNPFWKMVKAERIGDWKIFERDGWWYGYGMRYNAWWYFPTREAALEHVTSSDANFDPWA